ncbi:helix-turn-helix domain-containing protein [Kribbella sandramycini]|uniref:Helix-turn-helix domain-containing protein n=1 Tax=Kribbella sandramycini TaxID=60450 RepID=A0A7Y4L2C7_9ACTN|nr:transcriptional regulator with XRE-family HTH domain [Kribbella sandramycini]NOL43027.1 helix-turn-helix domain-containing protein [Kribbella sandramycini]
MSVIGERRSQLGLTQQQAAEKAGVSMATWRRFEQSPGLGVRSETVRGVLRALRLNRDELSALLDTGHAPSDPQWTAEVAKLNKLWTDRIEGLTPRMVGALQSTLDMGQDMLRSELTNSYFDPTDDSILEELDPRIFVAVGNNLAWYQMLAERMQYLVKELGRGRFIDESCQCFADAAIFAAAVRCAAQTWDDNESMGVWHELADDLDDDLRDDRWDYLEEQLDELIPFREWDCVFPEYRKARLLIERRHPHTWFDEPDDELQQFRDLAPYNILAQELAGPGFVHPPAKADKPVTQSWLPFDDVQLVVPEGIGTAVLAWSDSQEQKRGNWPDPRKAQQPQPPWPSQDNPVMRYLLWKADAYIEAGVDPVEVMVDLAVTAWFEGGVEGYDRGQHDARRPSE